MTLHSRSRAIVVSLLRGGIICALVVAGSLITGSASVLGADVWVLVLFYLVLWSSVFVAFLVWSLKSIRRSDYPEVRAGETLAVSAVLILAIFSKAYLLISTAQPAAFNEVLDAFTAYYYALTILSSVGLGDITPVNVPARAVTMVQMAVGIVLLGFLVRLVTSAVRVRRGTNPTPEVR